VFCVTDLAIATIGAAILAIAELASLRTGSFPAGQVDRRLASLWFEASLRPLGWSLPLARDQKVGRTIFFERAGLPPPYSLPEIEPRPVSRSLDQAARWRSRRGRNARQTVEAPEFNLMFRRHSRESLPPGRDWRGQKEKAARRRPG
jgi:hypothetical protein